MLKDQLGRVLRGLSQTFAGCIQTFILPIIRFLQQAAQEAAIAHLHVSNEAASRTNNSDLKAGYDQISF